MYSSGNCTCDALFRMRMTCNDSTSSRTLVQLAGGKSEGRSGRCLAGELLVVRAGSAATSTFSTISKVIVGLSAWKRQRRAVMLQSLSSLPSTRSSESISPGGRRRDVCRICRTVGIRRAGGRCNISSNHTSATMLDGQEVTCRAAVSAVGATSW